MQRLPATQSVLPWVCHQILGGSWVVISGVINPRLWVIIIVTLLITLLITAYELQLLRGWQPLVPGFRASGLGADRSCRSGCRLRFRV